MNTAFMVHPLFVQSCDKWTCNNTSIYEYILTYSQLHPQTVTIVICFSVYHAEFMCANSLPSGLDIRLLLIQQSIMIIYRILDYAHRVGKINIVSIKAYFLKLWNYNSPKTRSLVNHDQ